MKRSVAAIIDLVLAAMTFVAAPASATPDCGIRWGSLAKSVAGMSAAPLTNVRAGRHDCYDRVVLDIAGPAGGHSVQHVAQVRTQAKGDVVPLRGGARLEVVALVPADDLSTGATTYRPANTSELVNVTGYRTLRQVAWAGSYAGYTSIGVGVRARLLFRAFVVRWPGSGSRLVVDVAHRW